MKIKNSYIKMSWFAILLAVLASSASFVSYLSGGSIVWFINGIIQSMLIGWHISQLLNYKDKQKKKESYEDIIRMYIKANKKPPSIESYL